MNLSDHLFWDVDRNTLSFDEHKEFLIRRVFMRGERNDFHQVLAYYGKEACLEALKSAPYLDKKTLSFCAAYFNLEQESFRCYERKQLISEPWSY